jgi:hypothetical protein
MPLSDARRFAAPYYKLEHEDGTPADPPTFHTALPTWLPATPSRLVEARLSRRTHPETLLPANGGVRGRNPPFHIRRRVQSAACERPGPLGSQPGPRATVIAYGVGLTLAAKASL